MAWIDNFNNYLHNDIDNSLVSDFEKCDRMLQIAFKKAIIGAIDPIDTKQVFDKTKNTALYKLLESEKTNIDDLLNDSFKLGVAKNNDYGSDNILKFGIIGLIIRIEDKISRYENLSNNKNTEEKVKNESLKDTLIDIVNYSTYGEMLSNGVWE
jgi:hypothetical protein